MIVFAVVFGLLAVFVAQSWLNRQAELRLKNMHAESKTVPARTVVVAASSLRFGVPLSAPVLREVAWPQDAVPSGTFESIADLLSGGKRIVLTAIEPNEAILASKITGSGQRATLSALIEPGMKAVTIRVNDVDDVAGFVLPGDRVDVLLTRQADRSTGNSGNPGTANNDVVLQDVRVLAVDQLADERADKPAVAKAVTLEVDTVAGQKLSLAGSVGTLSLVLRRAGEAARESTRRVTSGDLGNSDSSANTADNKRYSTVNVTRNRQRQEYVVPAELAGWRAVEEVGRH